MTSRISTDLELLAGPACAGRLAGSPGAARASSYLARSLQEVGIVPAGDDGYFSGVDVPRTEIAGTPTLAIDSMPLRYRTDFVPHAEFAASGSGEGRPVSLSPDGENFDLLHGAGSGGSLPKSATVPEDTLPFFSVSEKTATALPGSERITRNFFLRTGAARRPVQEMSSA